MADGVHDRIDELKHLQRSIELNQGILWLGTLWAVQGLVEEDTFNSSIPSLMTAVKLFLRNIG